MYLPTDISSASRERETVLLSALIAKALQGVEN
jgi:hypothetical protein